MTRLGSSNARRSAAVATSLTLSVESTGGAIAGRFFEDIGSYAFSGNATGLDDGTPIEIYRHGTSSGWSLQTKSTLNGDSYSASLPVRERGTFTFAATTGGLPGSGGEITSNEVTITVYNSKITLDQPLATIDSLKSPRIGGTVVPARSGVEVHIEVMRSGIFQKVASTTTDPAGHFSLSLSLDPPMRWVW